VVNVSYPHGVRMMPGQRVDFTFGYSKDDRWIGADYQVVAVES
jgi:hypothetical protein